MKTRILTLLLVITLGCNIPVLAQDNPENISGWSTPVALGAHWFPDVVVDSMGRVHVAWASGDPDYDTVMYANSWDGNVWSEPNDVAAVWNGEVREATRPALLVDQAGMLHLTFQMNPLAFYTSAPLDNTTSAAAWSPLTQINNEQVAYFTRMGLDSKGVYHFVYTENSPSEACEACYHIYYRRSVDGGLNWSVPQDISWIQSGAAKPQLVIDDLDNLHLVWEAGYGGGLGQLRDPSQVMYAASYDSGTTWSYPLEVDPPESRDLESMGKNIALGWDGYGSLLMVWQRIPDDTIHYRFSTDRGRTWSPPAQVPGIWGVWSVYQARLDTYSLTADSAGRLHLIAAGRLLPDQTDLRLLHLTWDGSQWSPPETITTYHGDVPEWPRAVVGLGNQLHVVWFVRNQESVFNSEDNSQYQVMYTKRTVDALAVAPQPWPTAVPTATPSATATPVAMVTSVPTGIGLSGVAGDEPQVTMTALQTENDDVIRLAKSLAPEALLLGVILIAVKRRQARRSRLPH